MRKNKHKPVTQCVPGGNPKPRTLHEKKRKKNKNKEKKKKKYDMKPAVKGGS